MEVDLGLGFRPLPCAANQEHHLRLNCLDVKAFVLCGRVVVSPHVQEYILVVVAPSVAVVAGLSLRVPSQTEMVANRLLGQADVDRLLVDANNVQLRLP
jgi:hypothetical protein